MECKINDAMDWIPLIVALVTGLFAVFQVRENNVNNARLKWLDALRQDIGSFVERTWAMVMEVNLILGLELTQLEKGPNIDIQNRINGIRSNLIDKLKDIEHINALIRLKLSPNNKQQNKLEALLDAYFKLLNTLPTIKDVNKMNALNRKLEAHSNTISLLARQIIDIEWRRATIIPPFSIFYFRFGKGRTLLRNALELKMVPEREPVTVSN